MRACWRCAGRPNDTPPACSEVDAVLSRMRGELVLVALLSLLSTASGPAVAALGVLRDVDAHVWLVLGVFDAAY